jgi:hypothetical protein
MGALYISRIKYNALPQNVNLRDLGDRISSRVWHKQNCSGLPPEPVGHQTPVGPPGGLSRERHRDSQRWFYPLHDLMGDRPPSRAWPKHRRTYAATETGRPAEPRWVHLKVFAGGPAPPALEARVSFPHFFSRKKKWGPAGGGKGEGIAQRLRSLMGTRHQRPRPYGFALPQGHSAKRSIPPAAVPNRPREELRPPPPGPDLQPAWVIPLSRPGQAQRTGGGFPTHWLMSHRLNDRPACVPKRLALAAAEGRAVSPEDQHHA